VKYSSTPAQREFLKRRAIKQKDEETSCDCPGCDACKGFVRNCKCDQNWEALRAARQTPSINRERAGIAVGSDPGEPDPIEESSHYYLTDFAKEELRSNHE
jgi:hypothetical protein